MDGKLLKQELKEIHLENLEETITIGWYALSQYYKSLFRIGKNSAITQNNLEILKLYLQMLKEENKYYHLLYKNQTQLYVNDVLDFLDNINVWKEKFIQYLIDNLDALSVAYEMNEESRAKLSKRNFALLNESNKFREEVIRLILGENVLQNYFQFPCEFWKYIEKKTIILETYLENDMAFIGVYPKLDWENCIRDIKIILPQIIDLKSLLITIHELNHAFVLYNHLGKEMPKIDYEQLAREEEDNFLKHSFKPLYDKFFKNK